MAKMSKSKKAPRHDAVEAQPLDCCSMALDIVFTDPNFKLTATPAGKAANSIRISHPKEFYIPGLSMDGVNGTTTPWQIYIVPGHTSLALSAALKSKKVRRKKR